MYSFRSLPSNSIQRKISLRSIVTSGITDSTVRFFKSPPDQFVIGDLNGGNENRNEDREGMGENQDIVRNHTNSSGTTLDEIISQL